MNSVCLRDITDVVGGQLRLGCLPPLDGELQPIHRIVTDSRDVRPGDLFWAVNILDNCGANFAELAFSRGASGVVVSGRRVEPWAGKFCVEVDDAYQALQRLGFWAREMFTGTLVLVANQTGEAGLRQEIDSVLRKNFTGKSLKAASHTTEDLALALLQLPFQDHYGVLEVDVCDGSQLSNVAATCQPDVLLLSSRGEGRQSISVDRNRMTQLRQQTGQPATVVIPEDLCDNSHENALVDLAEFCVTVGLSVGSEVRAIDVHTDSDALCFSVDGHLFRLPDRTTRKLSQILMALAVGRLLGHSMEQMEQALVATSSHRVPFVLREKRGVSLLHVTQTPNRQSVNATLEQFRDLDVPGRRIVVCADLPNSESGSADWHREIGAAIVRISEADLLVACGQSACDLVVGARDAGMPLSRAIACRHPDEALPILDASVVCGDVVLLHDFPEKQLQCIVDTMFDRPDDMVLEVSGKSQQC